MEIVSWIAVCMLAISYWFQIYKIHVHKEVRDLSVPYHLLLAMGFGVLGMTAYMEGSMIFLAKQVLTTVPVLIILLQIYIYRSGSTKDQMKPTCHECSKDLNPKWISCPWCHTEVPVGVRRLKASHSEGIGKIS